MTAPPGAHTLSAMIGGAAISHHNAQRPEQAPASRWLWPLAAATIAIVAVLSLGQRPTPALHGGGLPAAAALLVLIASGAALLRRDGADRAEIPALAAMIAASAALVWIQTGGPGVAGFFVAIGYAAMRLSPLRSLAVLALAVCALAVAAVHTDRSRGLIVASELGLVAFYVVGAFARHVQDAHERMRQLLVELEAGRRLREEAAALRERGRIAREMHDVLAHSLSGLMLQLEGARMLAARSRADSELALALGRAHHLAQQGLEEARRAIAALRDERLPGADLLEQLTADFERDSRIESSLQVVGTPRRLDSETSLTLYRVAQEALTNSRKHARAERVELHLGYEPGGVRLVVEDHARPPSGDGAPGEAVPASAAAAVRTFRTGGQGYGLTGMRERAELLGGRLRAGNTGDGYRVELWVPLGG
jgi:signal transduction histidine kinase